MDEVEWWEFDTPREMAEQAAGDIAFVIESAIEAHDGARIAVPGGAAAEAVYAALLRNKEIDWSKVTLLPTDDRLVGPDDADGNHARLEKLFGAKGANVVALVDEAALDDYREAGRLADERLKLLQWPLDLVMLGVGETGDTAAIFPGPDFEHAVAGPRERRAVGVRPDPALAGGPGERVTLTAAALASARAVMVVVTGGDTRALVEKAIAEGPLSASPIGRVISGIETSIDIFWSAEG
jgi:6-phosphogluconolactonase